jgi:hypothetical protein
MQKKKNKLEIILKYFIYGKLHYFLFFITKVLIVLR